VNRLQVEIWSDVVCPWCAIGRARFLSALERFEHADAVDVRVRAFELDPAAPRTAEGTAAERLAAKYGTSLEQARAMHANVTALAAEEGFAFDYDRARPGNTFDAHRLLQLAWERGVQPQVKDRLLRAYFEEGEAIGDPETLARLAAEAGLDPGEVRSVLAGDAYAEQVREDEALARGFGITGVPFFVLDRRLGVSGAQSSDLLLEALRQAWAAVSDEAA
jgi:predicted DsbA family dithiol-disulfide isomerase